MPLLSFRSVDVRYGDLYALQGASFDVSNGERVALIGPSGAGKSTLLGVASARVTPSAGQATFQGIPIVDTDQWRKTHGPQIGTIHQQLHLVGSLKVVHNVNAGRLAHWSAPKALWSLISPRESSRARSALAAVGISDKISTRTDRLSGGEQQRVAIARVLVQDPVLVLADEPVSSLDPARADDVMSLLVTHTKPDCALVVSVHTFSLARKYCDRIIGLRGGAVMFDRAAQHVSDADAQELYRIPGAAQFATGT